MEPIDQDLLETNLINILTIFFPLLKKYWLAKKPKLVVFGNDYPTPDGTRIRDYICIYNLAVAHVLAMENFKTINISYEVYSLGSGCEYSVLEIVHGYEKALGKSINY